MRSGKQPPAMLFYLAMLLTIVSSILYHLFQKATPGHVHPLITLTVTYAGALVLCLLLLPLFPLTTGLRESLRQLNWASVALAFTIFGIEAGFLLAYRAGWNISLAALVTNVAATIILIPVGLAMFSERLSASQILGIVLCVAGLVLINRR